MRLIWALQWVRIGIPEFAKITAPPHIFTEKVHKVSGNRTRTAVAKVNLQALGWMEAETKAFEKCKTALTNLTKKICSVLKSMEAICFDRELYPKYL